MGPLAGLRVIDLSPNRVGAQISQLFGDFGADVIQIEPPGGGGHVAEGDFTGRAACITGEELVVAGGQR